MKLTLKVLLSLGLVASMSGTVLADCSNGNCDTDCDSSCKTVFLPFSQSENLARDYAGVTRYQYLADADDWNFYGSIAVEYQRNFDRCRLGRYFFPTNNTLSVGPCDEDGVDVRSVDLGLSSTFRATLKIEPRVRNFIVEPALYVGFDRWVSGLWATIKLPIVNTRWELDCCETVSSAGGAFFNPDNLTSSPFTAQRPEESLLSNPNFLPGSTPTSVQTKVGATSLKDALTGVTFGDKKVALKCCKILCCSDSKTAVADIPLNLGYNFINQDSGYLGLYGRLVIPTGRHGDSDSIFTPRVGYDHWQLGAGLNGRLQLYDKDEETKLNAILDLNVTHIFRKKECRCFDLKDLGCMSRFALLKEADKDGNYTGNLVNFADIFTVCVKSKFNWNFDGVIFLDLQHKAWNFDLGYELKHREKESSIDCSCLTLCECSDCDSCDDSGWFSSGSCNERHLNGKSYGVKGTLALDGVGQPVTTASTTKINACTAAGDADTTAVLMDAGNIANFIDLDSGRIPSATSHKIWGNVSYNWTDRDYPVTAGIFGEVEFGSSRKALRLWGIGAKAAVAYN
jgi:hypothetical protein